MTRGKLRGLAARTSRHCEPARDTRMAELRPLFLVLLLLLPLVARKTGDPGALKRLVADHFNEAQLKCMKEDKFLYDGECHALTTQGPCDAGQWLVLDANEVVNGSGRLQAACRPCACCHQQLRVYMYEDGLCHHRVRERSRFCPHPGTELRNDVFGEGACMCSQTPGPHARLEGAPGAGACYPLLVRGPCPAGRVLVPVRGALQPAGRCEADPCASRGEGFARWAGDGKCHRLGSTPGPCGVEGSSFNVHPGTLAPECILPTNSIVRVPTNCNMDSNGECQKAVQVPRTGLEYAADVLLTAEGRRKRRRTRT